MGIPFSRNSSSWDESSLRISGSGRLCLRRARTYSASAAGSASHLGDCQLRKGEEKETNIGPSVRTSQGLRCCVVDGS